jgi:hypothetical protein
MSVFLITGCRASAVTGACVGQLEIDGVEHYTITRNASLDHSTWNHPALLFHTHRSGCILP